MLQLGSLNLVITGFQLSFVAVYLSLAQQLYIKKQGSVRRDDPSSTPLAIP